MTDLTPLLTECHTMLRQIIAAQGASPSSGVSERLLHNIAMAIEPDDTAVGIRQDARHGLTLCTLGQLKAIVRMAWRSMPLPTEQRQRIELFEANHRRQDEQDFANRVKIAVLTELVNHHPPMGMLPFTEGQVAELRVIAEQPFELTQLVPRLPAWM